MFLQKPSLFKSYYTSPAKRNAYYFYSKLNIFNKHKYLTLRTKSKAGRNDTGRIVFWTRSALLVRQRSVRINYNLRYFKLGLIVSFKFIPFKNKLLSLIYFSNGAVTYYLSSNLHFLFSYIFLNRYKKLRKFKLKNTFLMLFQIKKLSFISCLELLPGKGAQYCRSSGTKGKIIKFDKDTHSVLVQLPSKIKKIFSYYSFALLNRLALADHKRYANTKSGY